MGNVYVLLVSYLNPRHVCPSVVRMLWQWLRVYKLRTVWRVNLANIIFGESAKNAFASFNFGDIARDSLHSKQNALLVSFNIASTGPHSSIHSLLFQWCFRCAEGHDWRKIYKNQYWTTCMPVT